MTVPSSITLVVADDHPLVLQGVHSLAASEPDMTIVAMCQDGEVALGAIHEHNPSVAVLDLNMPKLNGLGVLESLVAEGSATRVIFLSGSMADDQIHAAVTSGAHGIILKDSAPELLLDCVRQVASGSFWFPADLVNEALDRETARRQIGAQLSETLTARECEIMLLVAENWSNKEIARKLDLSEGTVKIHLHNIYSKVGASKRSVVAELAHSYRDQLTSRMSVR